MRYTFLLICLSLPLLAQEHIPERMIKRLVMRQMEQRKAGDKSDEALEAIQQFCKVRDQVLVASKDGILLPSRCYPKSAATPVVAPLMPPKAEEKPKADGAQTPK